MSTVHSKTSSSVSTSTVTSSTRPSPTVKSEAKIEFQTNDAIDKSDSVKEVIKTEPIGKSVRAEALAKFEEVAKSENVTKTEVSKTSTLPRNKGSILLEGVVCQQHIRM